MIFWIGFKWRRLRIGPFLTEDHALNRYVWCCNNINTDFSRYIFVDETKICLNESYLYHWRYPKSRPKALNKTNKFRKKINIWGGISFKGPTEFPCFTNNMDALHYRQIICDFLFPFIAANYSIYEVVLHQDNDPKHSSLLCKGTLEINGVNWVNFLLH